MPYDESESEPLTELDTENNTKFHAFEGTNPSDDPYKWKRLSLVNTGAADSFGNRDEATSRLQDRLASWDAIAGENNLDLTDYQKAEGRRLIEDIDLRRLGGRLFLACFCVASHVVREDTRSERVYHPRRKDENNCELFVKVADEFNWNVSEIHGYLNRVEDIL